MVQPEGTPPSRSVIVVTAELPGELRRCLAAIVPQLDAASDEIIVADGSSLGLVREGTAGTHGEPAIRVLHRPHTSLEVMRDAAVRLSTGDIVLFTEAHMEPAPDWVDRLTAAHLAAPHAAVIGGSIAPGPRLTSRGRALFTCEYAMVSAPLPDGGIAAVSAANVSYKRTSVAAPPAPYQWDAMLHHRHAQPTLRACDARVQFVDGYTNRSALAMRFAYGRAFAARRPFTWPRRALYAAGCACLPVLALMRARRRPRPQGMPRTTVGELVWVVALLVAWAAGEAVGYVAGPAGREQMW